MSKNDRSLQVAKAIAAICAVLVVLLSFGAYVTASSMGAYVIDRPKFFVALIVIPVIAVALFIWASSLETQKWFARMAAYLMVVATLIVWVVLTRF